MSRTPTYIRFFFTLLEFRPPLPFAPGLLFSQDWLRYIAHREHAPLRDYPRRISSR